MKRIVVKLKQQGQRQIVTLPQGVHLQGREAVVEQMGNSILVTPMVTQQWPETFWQCLGKASSDFSRPVLPAQDRDTLFS